MNRKTEVVLVNKGKNKNKNQEEEKREKETEEISEENQSDLISRNLLLYSL